MASRPDQDCLGASLGFPFPLPWGKSPRPQPFPMSGERCGCLLPCPQRQSLLTHLPLLCTLFGEIGGLRQWSSAPAPSCPSAAFPRGPALIPPRGCGLQCAEKSRAKRLLANPEPPSCSALHQICSTGFGGRYSILSACRRTLCTFLGDVSAFCFFI